MPPLGLRRTYGGAACDRGSRGGRGSAAPDAAGNVLDMLPLGMLVLPPSITTPLTVPETSAATSAGAVDCASAATLAVVAAPDAAVCGLL